MTYIALIQKRNQFGDRHFIKSSQTETKERFIERMKNCYKTPDNMWELEIYELGEEIYP